MKTEIISDLELDSLVFEDFDTIEVPKELTEKQHYVDNKALQAAFVTYHKKKKLWAEQNREGRPPLCNVIGAAILQISRRRAFSRNFISYTQQWKEEMISDAIETCVKYVHNYDPERFSNPFAYITQLVSTAMIQRIKMEKKHLYIKYKSFDNSHGFSAFSDEDSEDDQIAEGFKETSDMYNGYLNFIDEYEKSVFNKPSGKEVSTDEFLISDFIDEDEEGNEDYE